MKILNQAQAEAVYSAMCALNNVGGNIKANLPISAKVPLSPAAYIRVFEDDGLVKVVRCVDFLVKANEVYNSQAEFAAAYGLDGEPEMVEHLGLKFKVLAKFPEADSDAANAFMEANPNAGLLCIENGIAYLVDMADEGVLA